MVHFYPFFTQCVRYTQKFVGQVMVVSFFILMTNTLLSQPLTESFETGLPTSYTATTSYTLTSGTWTGQANGVIQGTTGKKSGSYSLQLKSQTGAQATTPSITWGNVSNITFWASGSTTPASVQVNYSLDGGLTWSAATGSPFSLSTSVTQYTATVSITSSSILIQFYRTAATIYIDDVVINGTPTPTLTATPISLSGFTYQSGYWASSPQSYNISGTNLTGFPGNIVVTPPTGYEVSSSSGGSYSASLNVPYSSATLTSTPVWVRLKSGLAIGTYSGNVANVGGGASTQNVALTGSVTKAVFTSVNTGFTDWYTGTTWDKGTVPGSGDDVVVNTGVYANSGITRDPGTATTITSSGNLGIGSGTYTNNGTTTVNGTFQINGGGYANGTDFKYASSGSTLIMNHNSGLYGINSGQTFWPSLNAPFNVTIDGTGAQLNSSAGAKTINGTLLIKSQFDINSSGLITVNGTLQINSGYISSNSPVYGNLSTLVYNTTYTPSLEWTGNSTTAGSGVPQNVTIQNSASISMPNSNRGMAGDLNINSGSLSLNGSSGDLYIAGNWTRALGATFTPNNRAVFFNGSGTQTVTVTGGGTENFDYLLVQNTSSLQLGSNTNINVNKPSGLTLSSTASTTIDLNGRTMALTGGGNLNIGASARNINSTVAGGVFNISGNTVTVTGSGSLTYGANTNLKLNNGLNCGTGSLVTVNNQLEIASGGYVTGNSPRYGSGSLLLYTAGDISPAYQRRLEWTSNAIAPAGTPGLPYHVQISNGTILNFISGTAGQMGMLGNLTIDKTPTPAALYMDYGGASLGGALTVMGNVTVNGNMSLGYSSGDDLKTEGDLTFGSGYAFTTNNRAIYFTKNGTQNIYTPSSAALTLPKIILGKVSGTGTTLNMNQDLTLAANASGWDVLVFTNTSDVLNINNKTHTIGQSGYNNTVSGLGSFKGSTTSNLTLLGTGNVGTLNFASGFQNLGVFTINRTSSDAATLGTPLTVNSSLALNNGLLSIGNNDLSLIAGATVTGTPTSTNMVVTNGTGKFVKYFSAAGNFTYPIGDVAGNYTPANLSFSGGSYTGKYAAVNVVNATHPSNTTSTDYIKRYWNLATTITGYTCNATFNYLLGDVTGTEANLLTGGWDGTNWYLGDAVNVVTKTLTVTGETALKGAYTGVDLNVTPLASSASDYFRSNGNGDWATAATWQSSPTGSGHWHIATSAPTSSAKGIEVKSGNTVTVTNAISLNQTVINGTLSISGSGSLTVNDGPGDDIKINNGGVYLVLGNNTYASQIYYLGSANIHIFSGGKIAIGNGASVTGSNLDKYATDNTNKWDGGSIFEWNNTGIFGTSNLTYFNGTPAGTKPIFRITKNSGTPGGSGVNSTTINGIFEVNDNVTFANSAAKTFRDGIIGTATLTLPSTIGTVSVTGSDPVLGGANLTLTTGKPINLTSGILVPAGANVKVTQGSNGFAKGLGGIFQVDGTLDLSDVSISNTSGSVIVNGTLKTSNNSGLYNSGNIASGVITLNNNSTIEYNSTSLSPQSITGTTTLGQKYYNIIFSGGNTKIPISAIDVDVSGSVKITGAGTIVDATSNNVGPSVTPNSTAFTMDDGRFRLGTSGQLPLMDGTYNLTGGVVEYTGSSAQTIRNKTYQNIEVTGSNVGNTANITLNTNGTFNVKSTGKFYMNAYSIIGVDNSSSVTLETGSLFQTGNIKGFHGFPISYFPTLSSSINSNITSITLQPGSTIEYFRSDDQPITVANGLIYQNLTLAGTGNKIAPSDTAVLTIQGNFTKTTGSQFVHNGGTVLFSGSAEQTYSSTAPIVMLYKMINSNNVNLTINDSLAVLKSVTLSNGSKLNLNSGDMILKSNDTTTASVAPIGTGTIAYSNGRFVVERYINTGLNAGQHGRSWQMLATPTFDATGQTIKSAWQEGATSEGSNPNPGYGIQMTSPGSWSANGFDNTSFAPSVKTYDPATNKFTGISSTNIALNNPNGYMVFVRGDRSVKLQTDAPKPTILRSRGKIYSSANTPPNITIPAGVQFYSIGNPYASAIDFSQIGNTLGSTTFYLLDPSFVAYQTYGRFVTITKIGSSYLATPPGGSALYDDVTDYRNIQSGMAFFVQGGASSGTVSFQESAKATGSRLQNRNPLAPVQILRTNLFADQNGQPTIMDGNAVLFDNEYSNAVDANDATKMENVSENFGLIRNGKSLAIEARMEIAENDTLYYNMHKLRNINYTLSFEPTNLKMNADAELIDNYLKTRTAISLSGNTKINFAVTQDTGSSAANRFMLVFKPAAGPVPVTFTNVNAHLQNKDIIVAWKTENEKGMNGYTLQASGDGVHFAPLSFVKATNAGVGNYAYTDADAAPGYHYYRIQSVDGNGKTALTQIVKVWVGTGKHQITVYPNPIRNNEVNLQFEGQSEGAYKARLLNSAGQVLAAKEINFGGGNGSETIQLSTFVAHGVYHLEVTQPDGKQVVVKVMK